MRTIPLALCVLFGIGAYADAQDGIRVLATSKTSTMEKEMNEAAEAGFRFAGVMGGDTSKTSTMQTEMQEAGDAGYDYRGQTVFKSTFGGKEVVAIVERDKSVGAPERYQYRLLATKKTSTMQKELAEAVAAGFRFVGLTVASTAVGGTELVTILRRPAE